MQLSYEPSAVWPSFAGHSHLQGENAESFLWLSVTKAEPRESPVLLILLETGCWVKREGKEPQLFQSLPLQGVN